MASIFEQFMQGQQLAQQSNLNRLRLQQSQDLAPLQQQLQALEIEKARAGLQDSNVKRERENTVLAGKLAKKALSNEAMLNDPEMLQTFVSGAAARLGLGPEFDPSTITVESLQQIAAAGDALGGSNVDTVGGVQFIQKGDSVVPGVITQDSAGNTTFKEVPLPEGSALIKRTPEQESAIAVKEAGERETARRNAQLNAAAEIKAEETRGQAEEKRRQEIIDGAFKAKSTLPTISKLKSLLETVKTGGFQAAKKGFTDFFGTTPADIGQFDALSKSLVLQNIKMLGGQPTEGERKFLIETQAALSQGGKVNEAILTQMETIAKNQINSGRFVASGGDPLQLLNQQQSPTSTPIAGDADLSRMSEKELMELRQQLIDQNKQGAK